MHDVAIVGAGPVGGTLALALADADLDVVALDARAPGAIVRGERTLALSHGARLIFERLSVWRHLCGIKDAITPITSIDISQVGGFGTARLDAVEQGLSALGYVVSYAALQNAIDAELAHTSMEVRYGTIATAVEGGPAHSTIAIDGEPDAPLQARLAVVADGTGTAVTGVARQRREYGQSALVAQVWMARPHQGVAYERFTAGGPIALLPEADHYGLVWTLSPDDAQAALVLSDDAFLAELARQFGPRVQGFERVASRRVFPLVLEIARPASSARTILVGNAAQALHPVAGQGFNLGVRDAFELAQVIVAGDRNTLGDHAMVAAYLARRRVDRGAGIAFTHGLTQIFGSDVPLLRWPRGVALTLLDALPPVKKAFTRAMLFGLS